MVLSSLQVPKLRLEPQSSAPLGSLDLRFHCPAMAQTHGRVQPLGADRTFLSRYTQGLGFRGQNSTFLPFRCALWAWHFLPSPQAWLEVCPAEGMRRASYGQQLRQQDMLVSACSIPVSAQTVFFGLLMTLAKTVYVVGLVRF